MKKPLVCLLPLLVAFAVTTLVAAQPKPATPAARAAFDHATALAQQTDQPPLATVAAFAAAIEADPDFLPAHEALLKFGSDLMRAAYSKKELKPAADAVDKAIEEKYAEWESKFPDSLGINYGAGSRYSEEEDPRAKPYLLKVVARDPKFARVWQMLSIDAERWGDRPGAAEYRRKATQAEPENPDYAFYHASAMREESVEKWEAASIEVARRFPASDRGAQALYWLGHRADNDAKRIAFWERARADFPIAKFMWTGFAMQSLFEAYLRTAPDKAIALARDLSTTLEGESGKGWIERMNFAKTYQAVRTLADFGNFNEALVVLDKLPVGRRSANPGLTQMLKAEVLAGAGKVQVAYDSIAQRFATSPADELRAALVRYGTQLGKTEAQVDAEVFALRTATAKPAPAFDLGLYTSDKSLSLASLKGKVVFITFWFPGCGPCRAEFPHFETVLEKFRGQDVVYLGINGVRKQDDYVLPFMAGTKYSFIPLKGGEIDKAYGVRGYPSNFLIDRDGRLIFSNFGATDPQSELVLQRMIESLLARPAGA